MRAKRGRGVLFLSVVLCGGGVGLVDGSMRSDASQVRQGSQPAPKYLCVDDTIASLLSHPAFAGFGRLLLPWDDRPYDERISLQDIASFLPFQSHVAPGVVVSSLNRLIADVHTGKTVFYDIYSE
jgi:hypothetical protein